jgi:hypothetical protein
MKVRFRQSGGFAGLVRGAELDTDSLPPTQAAELERLVAAASLPSGKRATAAGADRQQYEIAVERTGAHRIESRFGDGDLTDELAALVAFLRARAKPVKPGEA